MSAERVYHEIQALVDRYVDTAHVDGWTRERLTLLILGLLQGKRASPRRVAQALEQLGLWAATSESLERRIRRLEQDPSVTVAWCVHPWVKAWLAMGQPQALVLILDATYQKDRVVLLTVAVAYRGRSLPVTWAVWEANQPLVGEGFWQRVGGLLAAVAPLLPKGVPVVWLADRAFGTPAFTDLVGARGWSYVVRVQDQTRVCDRQGQRHPIRSLVHRRGDRRKGRGQVFVKRGGRQASVVVFWGKRHAQPLCLVSNRRPDWDLVLLYRRRFQIEALFRDYKTSGWQWEQGQVRQLEHLKRLLVGMALGMWVAVCLGDQWAEEVLARQARGQRRTRPPEAKESLFQRGLHRGQAWLTGAWQGTPVWRLMHWEAPNWSEQITNHYRRAYVFAFAPPTRSLASSSYQGT